jgi:hypothetical protein
MTPLVPARRRLTARTGVLGLTVLAATALGAGTAGAEGPATVVLDPTDVAIVLEAAENFGTAADPAEVPGTVPVAWGGTVELQLPDGLDAPTLGARLELGPEVGGSPTRVLSTDTPGPDGLLVSRVAAGRFTVALPPVDPANGPIGALLLSGIASAHGFPVHPDTYFLELDPTAPATVGLRPQVTVVADQPCDPTAAVHCAGTTFTAGTPFRVTVPPGSELRALGHGTLQDAEVTLVDLTGASDGPLPLSGDPARYAVAGPWDATVTLPTELRPGRHYLSVLLGDPTSGGPVTIATVEMQVPAAPAAVPPAAAPTPAAPAVVNAGLRSNTGVEDTSAGAARTGAVATGAGLLVLAGVGAVIVRARREPPTRRPESTGLAASAVSGPG